MSAPVVVSVVIPVFNGRAYIVQAVETALNQTMREVEIIVVDDGSSDGTPSLVASLPDPRITLLSQPNAGPSAARNVGIRHSTGRYVAFLDSDDLWASFKLTSQLEALGSEEGARWVYSSSVTTDFLTGEELEQHPATLRGDILCNVMRQNCIGSPSSVLVERGLLLEVGGFDETLGYAEDWDLWTRLAASAPVACTHQTGVSIRRREDSYGADTERMRTDSLRFLEKAFRTYAKDCEEARPVAKAWVHFLAGLGLRSQKRHLLALAAFATAVRHRPFWSRPYVSILATLTPRPIRSAVKRYTKRRSDEQR